MRGGEVATRESRPEPPAAARSASFKREARFALAPHVFACLEGSHVVLLDLKHDEYYALEVKVTRGLPDLVAGWPGGSWMLLPGESERSSAAIAGETLLVAESLFSQGLLVYPPEGGKHARPPDVPRAQWDLQAPPSRTPRRRARDLCYVARAVFLATLLLRCCSLERIVRRTLARKRRRTAARVDHARLMDLAERFERWCPLFFSAQDACLLHSLALLEFLAGHAIYPDWVFGVRTRPFAAHCWLQHERAVCNDALERVCRFTPILVA